MADQQVESAQKSFKIAYGEMVERVSVAGWQEAFGEKITWISHLFKISLLVLSGFCFFYISKSVREWQLHNGYKDDISDTPESEVPMLSFSNVTICAQVYFNQTYVKDQLNIPSKMIDQYRMETGESLDEVYGRLAVYLAPIMRYRPMDARLLRFMRSIVRETPQLYDFSRFAQEAYSSCENMLKRCIFDGIEFDCCQNAIQSIDYDGVCYIIMLNFDSDNAIPSCGTFHQGRPGPAGGLTVEVSMSLKDFPMLDDDADNGFKISIDSAPYTVFLSPTPAPHGAETFIKVTASKRILQVNCAGPSHLSRSLGGAVYYDPEGFVGYLEATQSVIYQYFSCHAPAYFYRPNASLACDPYRLFLMTAGVTFTDDQVKENDMAKDAFEKAMAYWKATVTSSNKPKHCTRWTYSSSGSFFYLDKQDESEDTGRMYSKIHVYYADLGYRQYNEVQESTWYLLLCDLGNVIGLYWGMSLMSFFHVLFYVPRYFFYLRKAHLAKAKVGPA